MSPEERARYIIDHVINRDTSGDVPITAAEIDRYTTAPHVSAETWATFTHAEKWREIDRGTEARTTEHASGIEARSAEA